MLINQIGLWTSPMNNLMDWVSYYGYIKNLKSKFNLNKIGRALASAVFIRLKMFETDYFSN